MSDKRNTDGMTISRYYSRPAVNSLCETIIQSSAARLTSLIASRLAMCNADHIKSTLYSFDFKMVSKGKHVKIQLHSLQVVS